MSAQRTVALDFDGPVHSYESGFTGYRPTDPPTKGAHELVAGLLAAGYRVVIYSARADCDAGLRGIRAWMIEHEFPDLPITNVKIAAVAYIDDRAVPFRGGSPAQRDEILAEVARLAACRGHGMPAPVAGETTAARAGRRRA